MSAMPAGETRAAARGVTARRVRLPANRGARRIDAAMRLAQGGFSLLEVLVAFTILALFLGGLYQAFGTGVTAARLGADYTRAALLAQSKLATLGVEDTLADAEESGEFDDRFHWRVTATPYAFGAGGPAADVTVAPYEVTVAVSWRDGASEREVSLTTLRLEARR